MFRVLLGTKMPTTKESRSMSSQTYILLRTSVFSINIIYTFLLRLVKGNVFNKPFSATELLIINNTFNEVRQPERKFIIKHGILVFVRKLSLQTRLSRLNYEIYLTLTRPIG